jgi:hypothetical protein
MFNFQNDYFNFQNCCLIFKERIYFLFLPVVGAVYRLVPFKIRVLTTVEEPDVATRYGLDGRGSIPGKGIQTGCRAHQACYSMGTGGKAADV